MAVVLQKEIKLRSWNILRPIFGQAHSFQSDFRLEIKTCGKNTVHDRKILGKAAVTSAIIPIIELDFVLLTKKI